MSRRRTTPPAPPVRKCVIYTRKSTTMGLEQEFNTLDAQRDACEAFIRSQAHLGWKLVEDRYDDGGFTGANLERPAFKRLMDDIEAGQVDVLVVYKVDRLSRSLLDFAQVMQRFNNAGVAFVSVTQNFNTADAMGRLTLNMLMSFSEFEREMIAERTRDKIAGARRRGRWTGGPVPLGYDVVDKKLVINELEAETVRELFRLYLSERSALTVSKTLNEQRRSTKRHVAKNGRVRQAKAWSKDAVLRTLRNANYCGLTPYKGEVYPGEHEGIISEQDFARAQAILASGNGRKHDHGRNPDYILRGILRCECCGGSFTSASTRNKSGKEYRYYRCVTRDKKGRDACPSRPLPAQAIEGFVTSRIREAVRSKDLTGAVADAVLALAKKHRKSFELERQKLPVQIAKVAAEGKALVAKLDEVDGHGRRLVEKSLEEKGTCLTTMEERLFEVERALQRLHESEFEARWVADTITRFDDVWDHLTATNRGRLVRALVSQVVVNEPENTVSATLVDLGLPDLPDMPDEDVPGEQPSPTETPSKKIAP